MKLVGIGTYLPQKKLTNLELERNLDTTSEWIYQRTGISERRVSSHPESTHLMASRALKTAIDNSLINKEEIDLILVATTTSEYAFPSTASLVAAELDVNVPAFDIAAACSGFVHALSVAYGYISSNLFKTVAVIGVDTLHHACERNDRNTRVIFGDGSGACIVTASRTSHSLSPVIKGKVDKNNSLSLKYPSRNEDTSDHYLVMNGRDVFKHAVSDMSRVLVEAISINHLTINDIALIVPHQANIRIVESIAKKLDVDIKKFSVNIERFGNTSAASIPIALFDEVSSRSVTPGDIVALTAFGGGFTYGCAFLEI